VLFLFYDKIAKQVFFQCYFFTNILVWIFARQSLHIGASGLVYGIASFLIFFGLLRKDVKSMIISIAILLLYGGLVYGIFPQQPGVSWESHLMGALVGLTTASQLSKVKVVTT
jgi:membrane associated rhomboid family serine protease